jgi:transmembrane sensor
MRQLLRWYDVEVAYASNGKRFSGRLSRAITLNDVPRVLEQSGVRFEIEGKKIMVLS